jgi:hypothetical protein
MMYIKNTSSPTSFDKFFIFIQSFFLIFFLFSLSSFAQVVIEERIEIGGITSKDNLKKGSSIFYKDDIPSGFIMPRSGMLQVFYGYLTHYDGPMPWYSTLNTYFFKDDSTRTDELTPRFTDYFYWQRNFPFCNPSTRWEWDYFPEEEYLYDVDRVTEGDTVQFTYFSDWVASQDTFTYGVYSATEIWVDSQLVGWDMLFGNYDWCMEEFDNVLYISVGVIEEGVLDHFEVTIIPDTLSEKDTLAFAETARLYIQAKDSQNNDIELSSDTLLTFKIETNENYGTFIDENGDTINTTPVVLNEITYGVAKDGIIKFAAVKENPDSIVTCRVKVYLQEDTTKKGEHEVIVLEQTLKIEMEEPYTVYPTYINSQGNRVYAAQLSQKIFDVKMTRGGEPVSNHSFKLFTEYVDDSGGHDHTNERPNNNNNYGYFLKPNDTQHYRPLEDSTSSLGRFDNVTYVASYFGDIMRIYLTSLQNKLFVDSIDIIEQIPNLVELGEGNNYELVGAPQNHSGTNDPCRPTPPGSQHSINHFGTQQLITIIQNIADDYASLHPGIRIRVNDISLDNGGLFDVNNNWSNPHQSHRMGTNADIGFTGIDQNDNCMNLNLKDLEEIITGYIRRPPFREGDHFHITVN